MKKVHVHATVNGREADFLCEPRQSLLEVLRDELRLTGTKEGCNNGNCGACNVLLDGRLVNSCLVLAVEIQGKAVTTIEGVAPREGLHPIQTAFMEADRAPGPPLAGRQPVPLHRLRQDRASGPRRREVRVAALSSSRRGGRK